MSVASFPRFAFEHLRRHVGGRARNFLGRRVLEPGHAHDAKIDQLQRSPALEDDIVGLDVAMDMPARWSAATPRASPIAILRPSSSPIEGRRVSRVSRSSPWYSGMTV